MNCEGSNILTPNKNIPVIERLIEECIGNSSRKSRAKTYLTTGELVLGSFPGVLLTKPIDWEIDPLGNRTWQWHLNWLSIIGDLLAFDSDFEHAQNDVLSECITIIDSWSSKYLYSSLDYSFEFIWHDHATALRAEQIVLFISYVKTKRFDWYEKNKSAVDSYLSFLEVHAEKLEIEDFYSKHTNHGLEQSRVLLLISTFYSEHAKSLEWRNVAIERIKGELEFSFTSEGVHVENSPSYHFFVFKIFLNLISQYSSEVLGDLELKFNSLAKDALVFLTHIIQPNGLLPIMGDTEEIKVSDVFFDYFNGTIEYENFKYVHSGGRRGIKPKDNFKFYPKSGYFIYRNGWAVNGQLKDDFQLIFKSSCLSNYHRQQDEGNFLLSYLGNNWLVDSGMYNHNRTSDFRIYMRSRKAHNVVFIPESQINTGILGGELITLEANDSRCITVSAPMNLYKDVDVQRRITIFHEDLAIKITDTIKSSNDLSDIQCLFHLGENANIHSVNGLHKINGLARNNMFINFESDNYFETFVDKGVKGGKVNSIISKIKNKHFENYCFKIKSKTTDCKFSLSTSIFFSNNKIGMKDKQYFIKSGNLDVFFHFLHPIKFGAPVVLFFGDVGSVKNLDGYNILVVPDVFDVSSNSYVDAKKLFQSDDLICHVIDFTSKLISTDNIFFYINGEGWSEAINYAVTSKVAAVFLENPNFNRFIDSNLQSVILNEDFISEKMSAVDHRGCTSIYLRGVNDGDSGFYLNYFNNFFSNVSKVATIEMVELYQSDSFLLDDFISKCVSHYLNISKNNS